MSDVNDISISRKRPVLLGPEKSTLGYFLEHSNFVEIDDTAPTWALIVHSAITRAATPMQANMLQRFLPYCLHSVANDPRGPRIVVNRAYSAVGCSNRWTDYESAIGWHVEYEHFANLHAAAVVDDRGYFYNDNSSPRLGKKYLRAYRDAVFALLAPWVRRVR